TLVAAVKAADLVGALQSDGPFTVFAPTNSAFDMLPKEALVDLMKPENKEKLSTVLTYHVVGGKLDAEDLMKKVKKGKGKAMLTTLQGEQLTVMQNGNMLWVMDANGGKAKVTTKDVYQKN